MRFSAEGLLIGEIYKFLDFIKISITFIQIYLQHKDFKEFYGTGVMS